MTAAVTLKASPLHAVRTKRVVAARVMVYGGAGLGKSTFGASAPAPVFIAPEDGLVNIDTEALPPPKTWADVLGYVRALATEDHAWKTVVLDSLDWLEPLCWARVCQKAGKPDIEAVGGGFKKGYIAAIDEWRILLQGLEALREREINVVLVAHASAVTFKNPEGDDFSKWAPKLHDKATDLFVEWCDSVLFACEETFTIEKGTRFRGVSSGKNILKTSGAAGLVAKNRFNLPPTLPLDWHAFADAVKAGSTPPDEQLTALLADLGDPKVTKGCQAFVAGGGSVQEAIQTVRGYLNEKAKEAKK